MEPVSTNKALAGRTILIAPSGERALTAELTRHGARVITWPRIEIIDPESFTALDEAIQNLFGYDWLVLANPNAAGFFLRRLQNLGHEISDLDALRVCALNDATRQQLEDAHVHVDLVPERPANEGVIAVLSKEGAIACVDQKPIQTATDFGLGSQITPSKITIPELALAIASYFSTSHTQPV